MQTSAIFVAICFWLSVPAFSPVSFAAQGETRDRYRVRNTVVVFAKAPPSKVPDLVRLRTVMDRLAGGAKLQPAEVAFLGTIGHRVRAENFTMYHGHKRGWEYHDRWHALRVSNGTIKDIAWVEALIKPNAILERNSLNAIKKPAGGHASEFMKWVTEVEIIDTEANPPPKGSFLTLQVDNMDPLNLVHWTPPFSADK